MWLWQDLDHFASNVSERLRGTADYRDDEQFAPVAEEDPLAPWTREAQRTAREVLGMVGDSGAVRSWAVDRVASCRQRLGLSPPEFPEEAFGGRPGREDQRS